MSNKADAMERVRELARQHPGWTPSQIALYLQGEGLAVTNEDVRRTLTRRTPVASTDPGVAEAPTTPQYAAPREEPRRSAIPTGLLFGVILFVVAIGAPYVLEGLGAAVSSAISIGLSAVVLVIAGAVASRRYAGGARAGMIAGFVGLVLSTGVAALVYYTDIGAFNQVFVNSGLNLDDPNVGAAAAVGLAIGLAISLFIVLLLGLILGWIGGKLFGRRRRRPTFG